MKTPLLLSTLLLAGLLAGCQKSSTEVTPAVVGTVTTPVSAANPTVTFDATGQTLLAKGTFINGVHTTSGIARLYDKGGVRTLVFENFSVDAGPDLRIYVAEDKALTNAIEVTKLTATGNFFVTLPAGFDPAKQRSVLIWCKSFSVLFGSATVS
jgi:Electron transfer DM13